MLIKDQSCSFSEFFILELHLKKGCLLLDIVEALVNILAVKYRENVVSLNVYSKMVSRFGKLHEGVIDIFKIDFPLFFEPTAAIERIQVENDVLSSEIVELFPTVVLYSAINEVCLNFAVVLLL